MPHILCTIEEPVYVVDGRLYYRTVILYWIGDKGISPMTRESLAKEDDRPNPSGK